MSSLLLSPTLAPPAWSAPLAPFLRNQLGFDALAPVFHLAVYSCTASFALQRLSSFLSPRIFGDYYPQDRRKKDDWDLHMVGWLFALVATPLALSCLLSPSIELDVDPLYGKSIREQRLNAIAVGYFLWDAFVTAKHIKTQGLGFFLHGSGCFNAFLFTLKPFLMWCGPNFLIWELSTIFLNAHWLFDKLKLTGSKAQLINGVLLVTTYISARLLFGTYNSYRMWRILLPLSSDTSFGAHQARATPMWIRGLYLFLNILMNGLNFFWFRLMLLALRKRFVAPPSSDAAAKEVRKPVPDGVQKGKLSVAPFESKKEL